MKTLLSLLLILILLYGCDKDKDNIQPYQPWWAKYHIKDTTGLSFINSINDYPIKNFLYGLKNEHLWIARFDSTSLEPTYEFIDDSLFRSTRVYSKGYGQIDTAEFPANSLAGIWDYQTKHGYALFITNGFIVDLYFFNSDGEIKRYLNYMENVNPRLTIIKTWNRNKLIIYCHNEKERTAHCFDEYGNKLFKVVTFPYYSDNEDCAISDEEYIMFERGSFTRINIRTGATVWRQSLSLFNFLPSDARIEENITKNNHIWTYDFTATSYEGNKEFFKLELNIETGETIIK